MQPLGNRVVVRPIEEEKKTASGLHLPSTALGSVQEGIVVAVGRGAVNMSGEIIPMEVSEGDKVLFPKDKGVEMEAEGDSVVLFHETDLYCIL